LSEATSSQLNTYIKRVNLKGYRTIRDVEAGFNPGLNIIIGKNGSGKTNFMSFLSRAVDLDFKSFSNFEASIRFGGKRDYEVKATGNLSLKNDPDRFSAIDFEEKVNYKLIIGNKERDFRSRKAVWDQLSDKFHLVQLIPHGIDPFFLNFISEPFSFSIDVEKYESEVLVNLIWNSGVTPSIKNLLSRILFLVFRAESEEASNLDLYFSERLANILKEFCECLNENIQAYLPIESVRWSNFLTYRDVANNLLKFEGILLEFLVNGTWLPFSSLSDGTKRLFFIYSEVLARFQNAPYRQSDVENNIILLEEPELGIHPHQFHLIMKFLKEMSEKNQIIVTTHAPQALNILSGDELDSINICSFNAEQGTTVRKLDAGQIEKAKKYMEEMYLSDYWVYSNLEERP